MDVKTGRLGLSTAEAISSLTLIGMLGYVFVYAVNAGFYSQFDFTSEDFGASYPGSLTRGVWFFLFVGSLGSLVVLLGAYLVSVLLIAFAGYVLLIIGVGWAANVILRRRLAVRRRNVPYAPKLTMELWAMPSASLGEDFSYARRRSMIRFAMHRYRWRRWKERRLRNWKRWRLVILAGTAAILAFVMASSGYAFGRLEANRLLERRNHSWALWLLPQVPHQACLLAARGDLSSDCTDSDGTHLFLGTTTSGVHALVDYATKQSLRVSPENVVVKSIPWQ